MSRSPAFKTEWKDTELRDRLYDPILVCEKCRRPTVHTLDGARWTTRKFKYRSREEHYVIIVYKCLVCGLQRVWGTL